MVRVGVDSSGRLLAVLEAEKRLADPFLLYFFIDCRPCPNRTEQRKCFILPMVLGVYGELAGASRSVIVQASKTPE